MRFLQVILTVGAVTASVCHFSTLVHSQTIQRAAAEAGAETRRVALVVGNDSYSGAAALHNGRNDARGVGTALRELGFAVTVLEDASQATMGRALAALSDSVGPDDVAFFYFAGHGIQDGGENFLIPTDYSGNSTAAVRFGAVSVTQIQAVLSKARVSMVVLDACRNNPYANQRGANGLAVMEARGSLIAFATGAGQTSSDNPGAANGLFTQELLRVLREPNLTAREAFFRVRQRVYNATNGRQFPAVYDGLLGDFVFRPLAGSGAAPVATRLTNQDILRLYQEKRPASEIVDLIRQADSEFDLTTNGLIRVKELPQSILAAMFAVRKRESATVPDSAIPPASSSATNKPAAESTSNTPSGATRTFNLESGWGSGTLEISPAGVSFTGSRSFSATCQNITWQAGPFRMSLRLAVRGDRVYDFDVKEPRLGAVLRTFDDVCSPSRSKGQPLPTTP
jgi:hypothetical protein